MLLDGAEPWDHRDDAAFDKTCDVTANGPSTEGWRVQLDCNGSEAQDHVLEVIAPLGKVPMIDLPDTVEFTAEVWGCIDCAAALHMTLRDSEGTLLFASYFDGVPNKGMRAPIDPETFYAPLTLGTTSDVCPDEPHDAEPCGMFVCSCRVIERRIQLDATVGEESVALLDGQEGVVGPLRINVTAHRYEKLPDFCDGDDSVREELHMMVSREG